MLKSLCIGGLTISLVVGTRRTIRYVCEPRGPECVPHIELPLIDLQKSATLAYLAYQEPKDIRKRLDSFDLEKEHVCIGDLCKVAQKSTGLAATDATDATDAKVGPPWFYDGQPETDAQAFLWISDPNKRVVYVAFRGTEDKSDALADLDVRRIQFQNMSNVKVHNGFYQQYVSIQPQIMQSLRSLSSDYDTIVTCGHSLGGALATIAAADFAMQLPDKVVKCHTCGSPRVGNGDFVNMFNSYVSENWRIYNADDPVPMIPMSHRFVHVRGGVCINDAGRFHVTKNDVPWFVRPFVHLSYFDILKPICDHDCKLYISRLESGSAGNQGEV